MWKSVILFVLLCGWCCMATEFADTFVVKLRKGANAAAVAQRVGAVYEGPLPGSMDMHVFRVVVPQHNEKKEELNIYTAVSTSMTADYDIESFEREELVQWSLK